MFSLFIQVNLMLYFYVIVCFIMFFEFNLIFDIELLMMEITLVNGIKPIKRLSIYFRKKCVMYIIQN